MEIVSLLISGAVLLYAIFRDNTKDTVDLIDRMAKMETRVSVHDSNIDRLDSELDKVQNTLVKLEEQIHDMNVKIERILTILEQQRK